MHPINDSITDACFWIIRSRHRQDFENIVLIGKKGTCGITLPSDCGKLVQLTSYSHMPILIHVFVWLERLTYCNSLTPLGVRALQRKLNLLLTLFWYPCFHMCLPALPASSLMPSQIFCAFLQVCALFFLAIKSDFLWSRERHNALFSFRTRATTPRL